MRKIWAAAGLAALALAISACGSSSSSSSATSTPAAGASSPAASAPASSASANMVLSTTINGTQVLTNFDIFATTGAMNKAVIRQFTATANGSGQINLVFTTVTDKALISGIEVQ